ncbi:deoxyribodipyrimidine photo-lyase [Streptoalloteichus tenebrarius]|uniref:Deoxyribodipyrimidine photo-lyase n=1 Tax=Streptoalloteichus tenebrarius (strain ATCC 17920 / DSM 40477 / JCM 4838 / CBS 697.72 / NBRC 16177 / NCIMB 11028 / NRRL B-12390 / A12253. 1 / ISP 5477) TaxID=1933 RepID=A0ABT1I406_STRSD|nr:deoxyribodipyrimidine photo-lyase [Streptoalloteichus tenebrarius]MCP2262463.1 deoxyribodipyrimidine photo-lyase [Streptoalloteichus tenebrarius]BFF01337.1 deoxyribodipyrimidine photo-lyase [Streptoalloteichus tenebrarius]
MDAAAVVWFRRDLRLGDHPALAASAARARRVVALFVLDDALLRPAGAPRRAFLAGCLRALDHDLGGRLLITRGDPTRVVPRVATEVGATSVHVSADTGPHGRERDTAVERALSGLGVKFVRTGSPYAVTPGRVVNAEGQPYRMFSAFYRAWLGHGWPAPAEVDASDVDWVEPSEVDISRASPEEPAAGGLPPAGERAALRRWHEFLADRIDDYGHDRDRPDRAGTSRLSAHLRWGCVHPRTLLHDLAERPGAGAAAFRAELAWREFFADVLWHRPDVARNNYDRRYDRYQYDSGADAEERFAAWTEGRTGYPLVDAGMRQLLAEGWMHNRVRMVVASFLVKDLHLPWRRGARHFLRHLVDADLASNQMNWQWVAGCGTDAAPYFRVFNPTTQAHRYDPAGDYVRRWVPELRAVPGKQAHTPWLLPGGPPAGYPLPIVDHAEERRVALSRFSALRDASP